MTYLCILCGQRRDRRPLSSCGVPRGHQVNEQAQRIIDTVTDAALNILYYDRKEDPDLPVGSIEAAVKAGEITIDEMVDEFRKGLEAIR